MKTNKDNYFVLSSNDIEKVGIIPRQYKVCIDDLEIRALSMDINDCVVSGTFSFIDEINIHDIIEIEKLGRNWYLVNEDAIIKKEKNNDTKCK